MKVKRPVLPFQPGDSTCETVESRLFADSMTGATAKSTPRNTKIDETELQRLQRQDHWLQMNRIKLIMDLMFVCESGHPQLLFGMRH